MALQVNYRGPSKASQLWTFDVRDTATGAWVSLGDNAFATSWGGRGNVRVPDAARALLLRRRAADPLRHDQPRRRFEHRPDAHQRERRRHGRQRWRGWRRRPRRQGGSGGSSGRSGTGGAGGLAGGVCRSTAAPPVRYQHVVVFSFENRTWADVGLGFSSSTMPYLQSLAAQCSFFSDCTETNVLQDSLTQYIGTTSGVNNPYTVNDCDPSTTCQSTDDNLFRQVRMAGGTARTTSKAPPPAARTWVTPPGTSRPSTTTATIAMRPASTTTTTSATPRSAPTRSSTPTTCRPSPGSRRTNATTATIAPTARRLVGVDDIQRVLDSAAYRAGTVAVFIWYDEDYPVPDAQIAPNSHNGNITQPGIASHAALTKTIEDLLGLPI